MRRGTVKKRTFRLRSRGGSIVLSAVHWNKTEFLHHRLRPGRAEEGPESLQVRRFLSFDKTAEEYLWGRVKFSPFSSSSRSDAQGEYCDISPSALGCEGRLQYVSSENEPSAFFDFLEKSFLLKIFLCHPAEGCRLGICDGHPEPVRAGQAEGGGIAPHAPENEGHLHEGQGVAVEKPFLPGVSGPFFIGAEEEPEGGPVLDLPRQVSRRSVDTPESVPCSLLNRGRAFSRAGWRDAAAATISPRAGREGAGKRREKKRKTPRRLRTVFTEIVSFCNQVALYLPEYTEAQQEGVSRSAVLLPANGKSGI